jgi:hypothetical protein
MHSSSEFLFLFETMLDLLEGYGTEAAVLVLKKNLRASRIVPAKAYSSARTC